MLGFGRGKQCVTRVALWFFEVLAQNTRHVRMLHDARMKWMQHMINI